MRHPTNLQIAERLGEAAELLERQGANAFRVRAYRRAAETVAALDGDLADLHAAHGTSALEELPGVGPGIAAAIAQLLTTGRWAQLERMRGEMDPESLFATVPGIGEELARRLHDELNVDTLEALETAAWDGRVAALTGIGPRRLEALREGLASRLGRAARHLPPRAADAAPSVSQLLDVDQRYRAAAARDALPLIAPRRFNPSGKPWLPVLHTTRRGWHYTVLHSNTARAHQLGRTHDWVVVYYYDDDHRERQCTIVTETSGPLAGRRVVRGREVECAAHYARQRSNPLHVAALDERDDGAGLGGGR